MAVDTRSKRASVLGLVAGVALALPLADGTVQAADRAHVSFCYAGLSAAALTEPTAEYVIRVRPDASVIRVRPDVSIIRVRPDSGTVKP